MDRAESIFGLLTLLLRVYV